MSRAYRLLSTSLLALACAWACGPVYAAGCPMCKESASALGEDGQKSLNLGIIVMLIPPLLVFTFLFVAAYRRIRAERRAGVQAVQS